METTAMRFLKALFERLRPVKVHTAVLGDQSGLILGRPMLGKGVKERDDALSVLERHGLRAHFYLPAIGLEDQELANACRYLAAAGYIITTADGTVTGKVASARPTKDEQVTMRRAAFKLVVSE